MQSLLTVALDVIVPLNQLNDDSNRVELYLSLSLDQIRLDFIIFLCNFSVLLAC